MKNQKVLIVGGVAGGASAAARLRRLSEKTEIILFEKGEYISFANCGLPYYIGGSIKEKSALTLQTPQSFKARFNVDVRINNEVTAIDVHAKTVTVKNHIEKTSYTESYDSLILSPGAEPIKPPLEGFNLPSVFTLRNIPDTYKIKEYIETHKPKSAVVVGAGFIGIEMAENLTEAGIQVTVVEMQNQVLPPLDFEAACEVKRHMESKGVTVLLENAVQKVNECSTGLKVTLKNAQEVVSEIECGLVILSIGVKPESSLAKNAGLAVNERGGVVVNEHMQTSDPHIYAAGDAVEVTDFITNQKVLVPLAGPANKQGRIAADNICGIKSSYKGTQGSAILKVFDLTVATTGINEKTAKKLGLQYEKSFTYSGSHAGYYPGATSMSIKTLFDTTNGKILGAQVVGYDGADKRCDVFATAIRFGATVNDLTKLELCYAPPYSSAKDPVNMAGFAAENILNAKVYNFHWHDVKDLPKDGSVILLDVRTVLEYQNGHIEGFINIPVDELRNRLHELDTTKKVYVTCQVGLRGYIACSILKQNGFECANLSGGYRLYNAIFGAKSVQNPTVNKVINNETKMENVMNSKIIQVDACGLQCPGPIVKLSAALAEANVGDVIEISTTDPAFASDIEGFCRRTANVFESMQSVKGVSVARVRKSIEKNACTVASSNGKNFIVFSGDLDKAIASFIMANASAALGRKVSMFFTFWGLNILRQNKNVRVKKDFISRMFGFMMPRGSKKLGLSKMNMGGMGAVMIRSVMKNKHIDSLEDLIALAQKNGVELVACSMSMDVMGIKQEELIDGVKIGGAAAMLAHAEESDMSLFI